MSIKDLFRKLTGQEDAIFVTFIQVALEDPAIRQQLVNLLSLPHSARIEALKKWQAQLTVQQANPYFVDAVAYLEDHARADKALELMLSNHNR